MIFEFAENKCIFEVLRILNKKESKYSTMFRETKVSHTTLQSVLKELAEKRFITRQNIGHMNVNYEISEKGKKLLEILSQLHEILKN